MSLVIKKQLVASRAKTYAGVNPAKYITIHETANTSKGANAQAHANLQTRGFSASWHWQVDDKQAIQSFPHNVRCWHAGDGRGAGNFESIGIEICVNKDGDFAKAVENVAKLTRKIMKDEGISIMNVVQHNAWSGKNCPTNLRNGSKGINWTDFIGAVNGGGASKPNASSLEGVLTTPKAPSSSANLYRVRKDWTESKSQLGAFKSLDNAKDLASKNVGYNVYDSKGEKVSRGKTAPKSSTKPKSNLVIDGYFGPATIRALQRYFGTPVDGVISRPSLVIKALQKLLGVTQDGYFGPISIRALQRRFGTVQDGVISKPSLVIRELQRRLNNGKL